MAEIPDDPLPSREPSAPEPAPPGGDAPRRETSGGVLGVGLGLLVGFLLLLGLLMPSGGALDGEEVVQELFGKEPLPFGLALGHAAVLPTGDQLLQLELPDVEVGGAALDGVPRQVVLIRYRSMKSLARLFREDKDSGETLVKWEQDPTWSWETILERDEIRWGPWRSKFARVRHFEEGGGWRESARVDLSQTDRPLVLMAMWGEEQEMDRDTLITLLNRVEMLEPEEG